MRVVRVAERAGSFAENKDIAREIRLNEIMPALAKGEEVTLDFSSVDAATQSFVHALISDAIRKHGPEALDRIYFKNCSETVKKIVDIVAEYMQEA